MSSKAPKPTTIIRAPRDKDNPYFAFRRKTAQDRHLSFEARGVLSYLLSKPGDWEISVPDLMREGDCGRDRVLRILKELETFGYMEKEKQTKNQEGKFETVPLVVREAPSTENPVTVEGEPSTEKPSTDKPSTENPQEQKRDSTESTEAQKEEFPAAPKADGSATEQQAMFEAVCKAWGYALDKLTPSKKKDVGLVASELVTGHARPDQIPAFKEWLDAKAKADDWKSYTIFAMKKWWPDYAASLPPDQPAPGEPIDDPLYDHQYDGKTFLEIQDMKLQRSRDFLASLNRGKL